MESAGPATNLPRFVERILVASEPQTDEEDCVYVRLPDARVDLVLMNTSEAPRLVLVGTRTEPLREPVADITGSVVLRFKPGSAYPFFGMPLSELTDQITPLEELWGDRAFALSEALSRAADPDACARRLEAALHERLAQTSLFEPASVHAVRRAMKILLAAPELPRIRDLAAAVGLSERQLRRSFDQAVGIGPKVFARIVRIDRALRSARCGQRVDWAAIAEAHGYYDQAHLIAECRALTGFTPEGAR